MDKKTESPCEISYYREAVEVTHSSDFQDYQKESICH